jgi:hypothetical protein
MRNFREWLIGTYNGLYRIVLQPSMPSGQTILIVILAFVIGLAWAYVLAPTIYYDGDPSQLEQGWQNEWVRLLSERYDNVSSSSAQGADFQQSMINMLAAVDNPVDIVDSEGINVPGFRELAEQAQSFSKAAPARPSIISSITPFVVGSIVLVVVSVIIALVGRLLIYPNLIEPVIKRIRGEVGVSDEATQRTIDAMRRARAAEDKAKDTAEPVDAQFGEPVIRKMSVYLMGRGQYDDSFEIEDGDDMFLGECGAAIAETIGEGSPQKVAAIEVWLFDKEDFVRTMTGVFVTEHAYNDPIIRSKLETKGDIVLIQPNAEVILETNTLRMRARVLDMGYGEGELPAHSFLENSTIEIAVWQKVGAFVGTAAAAPPPIAPQRPLPPLDIDFDPPPQFPDAPAVPATPAMPAMPSSPPSRPSPFPSDFPISPPPRQPIPPADDDPFGGTGDFKPVG